MRPSAPDGPPRGVVASRGGDPGGRKALQEKSGISGTRILGWIHMADLFRIEGIGPEYAELLECSGVDTAKELRNRNAGTSPRSARK